MYQIMPNCKATLLNQTCKEGDSHRFSHLYEKIRLASYAQNAEIKERREWLEHQLSTLEKAQARQAKKYRRQKQGKPRNTKRVGKN